MATDLTTLAAMKCEEIARTIDAGRDFILQAHHLATAAIAKHADLKDDLAGMILAEPVDAVGKCRVCDGGFWVCENHMDRPWDGTSSRADACSCGAGAPCPCCNMAMAAAGLVEPWRELAESAISCVSEAVRETNWGQPTFGPDVGEELQERYEALRQREGQPAIRGGGHG